MESEYASFMNTKPVVFITFRNVKGECKEDFLACYFNVFYELYSQHKYLFAENSPIKAAYRENLLKIYNALEQSEKVTDVMQRIACHALPRLLVAMRDYYGEGVYVFIDDYDIPFVDSFIHGYYKDVNFLITSNLTDSLKREDTVVESALLTGIQRIGDNRMLTGLNNLIVYTVKDSKYSQYFGFTNEETKSLLEFYGLELNNDVKEMYNGYMFGDQELYNPYSIINYAKEKILKPYWVNIESSQMIEEAMKQAGVNFLAEFAKLIEKGSVRAMVNLMILPYDQLNLSHASIWGLFLNTGYLTIDKTISFRDKLYILRIPNRELLYEFKSWSDFQLNENTNV